MIGARGVIAERDAGVSMRMRLMHSIAIGAWAFSASVATLAQPGQGRVIFVQGSTKRVAQLTGDVDRAVQKPTLSQTTKRFGILGTDLGSSFEHKGKLYFLFGDTIGQPGALDAIGWTNSRDPEQIVLDFHSGRGGRWLPPSVPGITQGGLEVPSGGISIDGTMFVVFTTPWKIAPQAATPVAIPTCRNVELMPDAMPDR